MVWKRRYFAVLVFVAVVVGVLVLGAFREPEPEYRGRKLSQFAPREYRFGYWAKDPVERSDEFREAMTHIGTNAIPWLLKWIQYERSPMRDWCYRVVNPILYRLKPAWQLSGGEHRALIAVEGFSILGAKAEVAVSRLAELMNDPRATNTAIRARMVIHGLSFQVLAADLVLMTNSDANVRLGAILRLEGLEGSGPLLRQSIPALIQCLRDKDIQHAKAAARVLGRVAMEPELVVPALIESLQRPPLRADSIRALAGFHTQARAAVPALRDLSSDPVLEVRELARIALQTIDPAAVDVVGKE